MKNDPITRRQLFGSLMALSWMPKVYAAPHLPIHDLNLPPELVAELQQLAERPLVEAIWVDELPLEGLQPALVFVPR